MSCSYEDLLWMRSASCSHLGSLRLRGLQMIL